MTKPLSTENAGGLLPLVWTNDDIEFGKSDKLQRQLDFLNHFGIPGVFFVIPGEGGAAIDQDQKLVDLMGSAARDGHEFYQHGFRHHAFECGVPDTGMFYMDQDAQRRFDEERASIEAMHTFEAQIEMLAAGQRVWRKVFGEDSSGFRPGWGAYCTNFYKALSALGYDWVSSSLPCMTSWLWNAGRWEEPMNFRDAIPTNPHRLPQGIIEFPIAGDYGFRVPKDPEKIDRMVGLGLDEFHVYLERRHPMVIVSHWHGLEWRGTTSPDEEPFPGGTGYAVHEKLITAILATGSARFTGMRELTEIARSNLSWMEE